MTQLTRFSVIRKRKKVFKKTLHYYRVLRQVCKRVVGLIFLANTASNHEEETLQRWRAVDNTMSDLNSPVIKPQTSHTEVDANRKKKLKLNTSK